MLCFIFPHFQLCGPSPIRRSRAKIAAPLLYSPSRTKKPGILPNPPFAARPAAQKDVTARVLLKPRLCLHLLPRQVLMYPHICANSRTLPLLHPRHNPSWPLVVVAVMAVMAVAAVAAVAVVAAVAAVVAAAGAHHFDSPCINRPVDWRTHSAQFLLCMSCRVLSGGYIIFRPPAQFDF
jgi:hypothetical protein